MSKRQKAKGRLNAPGGFAGIPRIVMKHPDYISLSGGAVKLLLELANQYKGKNNGDLTTAYSVLKEKGFKSKDTIKRATDELIAARLIVRSREGYFTNPGAQCALYALTWAAINECQGKNLSVAPTATPLRKFSLEKNKTPRPETGQSSDQNLGRERVRDNLGRYSSGQNLGRLKGVT